MQTDWGTLTIKAIRPIVSVAMAAQQAPAVEIEAQNVLVDREDGRYDLRIIDTNNKIHSLEAGALTLNGYGFSTDGCEISEYGKVVTVKRRDTGSRYVHLSTE
jgi:hypothetical protein